MGFILLNRERLYNYIKYNKNYESAFVIKIVYKFVKIWYNIVVRYKREVFNYEKSKSIKKDYKRTNY